MHVLSPQTSDTERALSARALSDAQSHATSMLENQHARQDPCQQQEPRSHLSNKSPSEATHHAMRATCSCACSVVSPLSDTLRSPDPKRCSVNVKSTDIHTVVTFERPCVPPKTQRQSIGRLPPVPNPMSFRRYAWPFKSYRGIGV